MPVTLKCPRCGSFFTKEDGVGCTDCHVWFCDNCYDCTDGDGCQCHASKAEIEKQTADKQAILAECRRQLDLTMQYVVKSRVTIRELREEIRAMRRAAKRAK